MALWRADLHVHTVLSGCAEREMLPPLIVQQALSRSLHIIAICDHNSAGNVASVVSAAGRDLVVKPGLEVETREGIHIVCLFDVIIQAMEMQELVYASLPPTVNSKADPFGERTLVDAAGQEAGREPRPLFAATKLTADDVAEAARERGGLVIAAHVERRSHGLLGVLGLIPETPKFDAFESSAESVAAGHVRSSDAHRLEDIGRSFTLFELEDTTVADLRRCLASSDFSVGVSP